MHAKYCLWTCTLCTTFLILLRIPHRLNQNIEIFNLESTFIQAFCQFYFDIAWLFVQLIVCQTQKQEVIAFDEEIHLQYKDNLVYSQEIFSSYYDLVILLNPSSDTNIIYANYLFTVGT